MLPIPLPGLKPALESVVAAVRAQGGIRWHFMCWMEFDVKSVEAAWELMKPYVESATLRPTSIQLDVEGEWWHGYRSASEVKRALVLSRFVSLFVRPGAAYSLGLTTHAGIVKKPAFTAFFPLAKYVALQVYSREISKEPQDQYLPGVMQRLALKNSKRAGLPRSKVVIGLSAQDQDLVSAKAGTGGTVSAMRTALLAATRTKPSAKSIGGVSRVAYWARADINGTKRAFISALGAGRLLSVPKTEIAKLADARAETAGSTDRSTADAARTEEDTVRTTRKKAQKVIPSTEDYKFTHEEFDKTGLLFNFTLRKWV